MNKFVSNEIKVSIIIVSWNTKQLLKNCLKSLKGMAVEIIVVDNGSTDGSLAMVAKEFPQVKLIKNKNTWFWRCQQSRNENGDR